MNSQKRKQFKDDIDECIYFLEQMKLNLYNGGEVENPDIKVVMHFVKNIRKLLRTNFIKYYFDEE